MDDSRTPVLRPRTADEELARLHPIERKLYRLFEFLSSLKLAVFLMSWLIVECVIGTFVESQVNAGAAKFFVYSTKRFALLLGLLGLNITCAALIRFPWKKYQTGFVVTHVGMLTLLFGSMMTRHYYLDALMIAPQGDKVDSIVLPDDERLVVTTFSKTGEPKVQTIPINFGPYTWGHRIFEDAPRWLPIGHDFRKGYTEEHPLDNGDLLRVKKFHANCQPKDVYLPDPSGQGSAAVKYRIFDEKRGEFEQWIAVDPHQGIGRESLMGMAQVIMWAVNDESELTHFVQSPPATMPNTGQGILAYSHAGKIHHFPVADLMAGPIEVPETKIKLEGVRYLKSAGVKEGRLVDTAGEPNPMVEVEVTDAKGEKTKLQTFGMLPELDSLRSKQTGTTHLVSHFPPGLPTAIHLAYSPKGKVGYRAFGRDGLIARQIIAKGEEHPSLIGFRFVLEDFLPSGRPDVKLIPASITPGKPENDIRGVEMEYVSGDQVVKLATHQQEMGRKPTAVGDKMVKVEFERAMIQVPFKIRLDRFEEPKNPGTQQAAAYHSFVTLFDRGQETKHEVYMNHPLYLTDKDGKKYTIYQSGIQRDSQGRPISTYTVANDSGLIVKYVGALTMCVGIVLMFYLGGYFKKSSSLSVSSPEPTSPNRSSETNKKGRGKQHQPSMREA